MFSAHIFQFFLSTDPIFGFFGSGAQILPKPGLGPDFRRFSVIFGFFTNFPVFQAFSRTLYGTLSGPYLDPFETTIQCQTPYIDYRDTT